MILVLYHHSDAFQAGKILQFHMPALFLLSGYTEFCLQKNTTFGAYVKTRFFRLIVPYFFFELLNLAMFIPLQIMLHEPIPHAKDALTSILTATNNAYTGLYGRLWFLPTMFVSSVLAYGLRKLTKKNALLLVCAAVLIALSYSTTKLPWRLPFTLDVSCFAAACLLIGYAAGRRLDWLFEKHMGWDILLFVLATAVFVGVNLIGDPQCFMYRNRYDEYPLMLATAASGVLLLFVACKWVMPLIRRCRFLYRIVLWFSIQSLAVFPVHMTVKMFVVYLLGIDNPYIVFVALLVLTVPIVNFIRHYLPFMLADFNKHKKLPIADR